MNLLLRLLVPLVLLSAAVAPARAGDVLVLKDGRRLEGKILREDEKAVVIEVRLSGMTMRSQHARQAIERIERAVAGGKSYCVIPITGPIGQVDGAEIYMTARAFRLALAEVERSDPDYVILLIDSPGGSIDEMSEIVQAMRQASREVQFIAYVEGQGLSAAAVIAMACPTIVMAPGATIGAAVPWQQGPDGTPQNIEEKFQSAVRATFREAARLGGHSPLLVDGMMETDLELAVMMEDGRPRVVEALAADGERVLKRRGRILTLTADEAAACGLSRGTAGSLEGVRHVLGVEAWHEKDNYARQAARNVVRSEQRQRQEEMARARRWAARLDYLERIGPELSQIQLRLAEVRAAKAAAAEAERELAHFCELEIAKAKQEHDAAAAAAYKRENYTYWLARAREEYNQRIAALRLEVEPQLTQIRQDWKAADHEERTLVSRWNRLMEQAPPLD